MAASCAALAAALIAACSRRWCSSLSSITFCLFLLVLHFLSLFDKESGEVGLKGDLVWQLDILFTLFGSVRGREDEETWIRMGQTDQWTLLVCKRNEINLLDALSD